MSDPAIETIDVYFDYASPFAYLASEVLPNLSDRLQLQFDFHAIDLSLLSNYSNGLPYSESKRRYVVVDAARSAQFHGIAMRIPKPHPVASCAALRIATVAQRDQRFPALHRALFRAAWRDQRDLGRREVLAECIAAAEGPVDQWLALGDAPESEALLAETTAAAEARGVFGVPSLFLADELFWGLDSLPAFEWRLASLRSKSQGRV